MKRRILCSICLISALTLALSTALIAGFLYGDFYGRMKREIQNETRYIAQAVEISGVDFLERTQTHGNRVTLVNKEGFVIFDSHVNANELENHMDRPEIISAVKSGVGESARLSESLDTQTYYFALSLSNGYILRLASSTGSVYASVANVLPRLLVFELLIFSLAFIVAGFATKRIIKPINELDLENPEKNECYEELTPLLTRIHKQNNQIHAQISELKAKRAEFTAITENMREGFILIDHNADVLSYNGSAANILGVKADDFNARNILSLNRSALLRKAVDSALNGNPAEQVIQVSRRFYQLFASPVKEKSQVKGAVILILDTTEKAEREQLRREFSANVSHELKTPLTSISGFAEIMKNGLVQPQDTPRFAENIYNETKRLISLVNDIIKLSQLDEGGEKLQKETVDLFFLAEAVLSRLNAAAEQRNVTLCLDGESACVYGVRQLLDEMVFNLCDNAIKYNREGGCARVTIVSGSVPELIVSDDGIGIKKEEQERVFERFYRVDKSHSKEIGGTGLGLSIVKHAALMHNASVTLESAFGKGTRITVRFAGGAGDASS